MEHGFLISVLLSGTLTSLVAINNRNSPEIKRVKPLNKLLWMFFIWLHWMAISHTFIMFSLIYPKRFWWLLPLYFVFILFHWRLFRNECILTYFEKKVINPDYRLGDDVRNAYYWAITGRDKSKWTFKYRLVGLLALFAVNAYYMVYQGFIPGSKIISASVITISLALIVQSGGGIANLLNTKETFFNRF